MKSKRRIINEFAAGCAHVSGGCIAYHGALQYDALQTQQFNTIYLHADKRFRPFVIDGMSYEYHTLKFTYNIQAAKDMDGTPFFVTSLSQTIVDCIRHIDLAGGLEELMYALSSLGSGQLNERDLLVCLEAYDNASLWSRVGYLLSLHQDRLALSDRFLNTCRLKGSGVKSRITSGDQPLDYLHGWKLSVPRNLDTMIAKGTAPLWRTRHEGNIPIL